MTGKRLGDMTPAERRAASQRAAALLEAELRANAEAIGKVLDDPPDDDGLSADELEEVPDHHNDLGDWCPGSGERTADGTCPQFCHEADVLAGFDAGDRELPTSTDLPPELWEQDGDVKYARHGWNDPHRKGTP